MPLSFADRTAMFFALEGSWLLCVLQLADTPLFANASPNAVALLLCTGALCLAAALSMSAFAPHRAPSANAVARVVGVVLFASGLYACLTAAAMGPGALSIVCLGLILAVTGMTRRRRVLASDA